MVTIMGYIHHGTIVLLQFALCDLQDESEEVRGIHSSQHLTLLLVQLGSLRFWMVDNNVKDTGDMVKQPKNRVL